MIYIFIFALLFISMISSIYSIFLFRKNKKLKIRTDEFDNLNSLRKAFIDADNRLIYLKDENLNYLFVNKATEIFYSKKSSEIIGYGDHDLTDKEFAEMRRKTDLDVLEKQIVLEAEVNWGNNVYKTIKFPIKLLNGHYGVGAFIEDVTEAHIRKSEKEKAITELKEYKDQLQLILNSTVEAIYGMDTNGQCTFCNASGLKMLGYSDQEELLGKDIHNQIHHSDKNGEPLSIAECKVHKALLDGKGTHVDDEVFWRVDRTSFDVEYYSYPQYKDGEIIGAVVTFMDITDRKKAVEEIKYLSYHDSLTGLYNRMFFEEELRRLDTERNLPISIIVGDVNGLKLSNDIFGHTAGDVLLKKVAEIFKKVCRSDDIIARVGGDEFVILLPKTKADEAEKIILRIKSEFSKEQLVAIRGSISMGCHTKLYANEAMIFVMKMAEDNMYLEKTLNRKNINENQIKTIIEMLHKRSPREEKHSKNVSEISQKIGIAMNLTDVDIKRLKDAGFLHDIGKIVLDESMINTNVTLTDQEIKEIKQHSVVGFRILNSFDETLDLAESVLAHHERWDGTGYPKGLKGEEIPLLARVLAVAESYDSMTNEMNKDPVSKVEAIQKIKKHSGVKLDPEIVKIFIQMMSSN